MPAPLSRSHSVYHICCMPDGPAKASAPTTIGKNAGGEGLGRDAGVERDRAGQRVAQVAQAADERADDGRADHEHADEEGQQPLDQVVDHLDDGEHDRR